MSAFSSVCAPCHGVVNTAANAAGVRMQTAYAPPQQGTVAGGTLPRWNLGTERAKTLPRRPAAPSLRAHPILMDPRDSAWLGGSTTRSQASPLGTFRGRPVRELSPECRLSCRLCMLVLHARRMLRWLERAWLHCALSAGTGMLALCPLSCECSCFNGCIAVSGDCPHQVLLMHQPALL